MSIDEAHFRSLVGELIDENPICRAVLSICRIEFTGFVETLSVSLGKPCILRVNLDFVRSHCGSEAHVKALVVHEFLHVLLGHTERFKRVTPALNIALDAVINAVIHRTLGSTYSSMMEQYYAEEDGLLRLLRPPSPQEVRRLFEYRKSGHTDKARRDDRELLELHEALYAGRLVSDDLLDVARQLRSEQIEALLKSGKLLLGSHAGQPASLEDLEPDTAIRVRQFLASIPGKHLWRDPQKLKPQVLRPIPKQQQVPPAWRAATLPVLRRLILPDRRSARWVAEPISHALPILHTADRRGCLRALWNPILTDSSWDAERNVRGGSVQIYLDVSGSMDKELRLLVPLLAGFGAWIRRPLWAFSTIVAPAKIVRGKLETETTGGTELTAVLKHIRKTRPAKALVITDGFVERPSGVGIPCRMEAIIPASGTPDVLKDYGIPVSVLPPIA